MQVGRAQAINWIAMQEVTKTQFNLKGVKIIMFSYGNVC